VEPTLYNGVRLVDHPDLDNVRRLDMGCLPMVSAMMTNGMRLNTAHLTQLSKRLDVEMAEINERGNEMTGHPISFGSADQVADLLFRKLCIKTKHKIKLTDSGKREQVDADQLEIIRREHPVIPLILDYRQRAKLKDTYTDPLPRKVNQQTQRLHTQISVTTAATGRLACVSGDTILPTSRGYFRFDEYVPLVGDKVLTHRGRWMPVVRKIYKGVDRMYRVCLSSGEEIQCTLDHRMLTPKGWRSMWEMGKWDKVYSYERQQVFPDHPEHPQSPQCLLCRRQAHSRRDGQAVWDNVPHSYAHREGTLASGSIRVGEATAVFEIEDGGQQPHVGQEWLPASQLHRRLRGPEGLSDARSEWQAYLCPSCRDDGGFGSPTNPEGTPHTPYQWGHERQSTRQSCLGDSQGSWGFTRTEVEIREVSYVGEVGVWDIEVEGDHSYLAGGLLNHNSRKPNLQNIPTRTKLGGEIRKAFVPSPGNWMGTIDMSQIELRVLASERNVLKMIQVFWDDGDLHTETAIEVFDKDRNKLYKDIATWEKHQQVSKCDCDTCKSVGKFRHDERMPCKNVNFGIVYDISAPGLSTLIVVSGGSQDYWTEPRCEQVIQKWYTVYPEVPDGAKLQYNRAKRYEMVWDGFGRIRIVPEVRSVHPWIVSAGLRQAGNMHIQAFAAGMLKLCMAEIHDDWERYWYRFGILPLMQIHDELLFEGPREPLEDFLYYCGSVMAGCVPSLKVPIGYGVAMSEESWGSLNK
jgi:DNA polymerase I-like protein with 3'-5' exonuclease and polymerase domains